MTLTKKDVVALADALHAHNRTADGPKEFTPDHLRVLADFFPSQDPNFNRKQWIDHVAREGGQGDGWNFVQPDSPLIPGAVVEDRLKSLKLRGKSSR